MQIFNIPMETPAKKNSKIMNTKTHRMFPSKRYQKWHDDVVLFVRKTLETINSTSFIILVFTHGDFIGRDSDNGTSSIFDMLKDREIIEDDKWEIIRNHCVFNDYSKGNPNCEIRIYDVNEVEDFKKDLILCVDKYSKPVINPNKNKKK